MAKIVDKEQKKQDIALSCKDLILEKGLQNLTVSQMAEAAGVGKGTIYEYFRNKEEIVFELARILIEEHATSLEEEIKTKSNTREKIKSFSSFFFDPKHMQLREIYKQFVALTLLNPQDEIVEFNTQSIQRYFVWFVSILEEGVEKKELKKQILDLSEGLFAVGDGLFFQSSVTNTLEDLHVKIDRYIDTIFDLMEI